MGVVLQGTFCSALPVVLGDIAGDCKFPSTLWFLTSLPIIMFALCSAFPHIQAQVGLEKLFTIAMIVLTLSSLFVSLTFLTLPGTIMLGGCAVLNVSCPMSFSINQRERVVSNHALYRFYGTGHLSHVSLAAPVSRLAGWKVDSRLTLICWPA